MMGSTSEIVNESIIALHSVGDSELQQDQSTTLTTSRTTGRDVINQSTPSSPSNPSSSIYNKRQATTPNYHELRTTFDGELGAPGVMFDVVSTYSTIHISYFGFHTRDVVPKCEISVYSKLGTHRGYEEQPAMWTMVAQGETQCSGTDSLTEIKRSMFNSELVDFTRVLKGQTRAFYITSTTPLRYTKTYNENGVHVYDKYMQILEGTGLVGYYKDLFSPRMWNGIVGYLVQDDSAPMYGSNHQFGEKYDGDACPKELEVSMDDNTGSYGYMFDVQSVNDFEPVTIYGLEFHTDRTYDLRYEIYTIKTGFQYGTSSVNLWTLIAKGTVKGAGNGKGTAIRDEAFASVSLRPGMTQGFYITLDSEDLRYRNSKSDVGSVFIKNDHIAVTVGAGVGEFPLANNFYYPRVWNGKVLYRTESSCPLEDLNLPPPTPSTLVKYNYVIQYPDEWTNDELYEEIKQTTEVALLKIVESDSELKTYQRFDNLKLNSVKAAEDIRSDTWLASACYPPRRAYNCVAVVIDAVVTHDSGIDVDSVTYGLLRNAPKISESLSEKSMIVLYFGDVALETRKIFSLEGVPDRPMGTSEIDYFRRVTKSFLTFNLEDGIDILSVEVKKQDVSTADANEGRKLQGSSLDVSTVVTGKHRPPPEINFDILVEDSINTNNEEFERELSGGGSHLGGDYFEDIGNVVVQPNLKIVDTVPPTQSPTDILTENDKEGGLNIATSIGIVVGVAMFTFGLVFGAFVFRKRVREKRTKQKQAQIIGNIDIDEDDPLFVDLNKYEASVRVDGMIDKDILIEKACCESSKTGETSKLSSVNSAVQNYQRAKRQTMDQTVSVLSSGFTMDDGYRPGLGPRNYGPASVAQSKEERLSPSVMRSKKSLISHDFSGASKDIKFERSRSQSIPRNSSRRSSRSAHEYNKFRDIDDAPPSPRRQVKSARDFEEDYENRIRQKHYGEAIERLQKSQRSLSQGPPRQRELSTTDNAVKRRKEPLRNNDYQYNDDDEYPRRNSPHGRQSADSIPRDYDGKPLEIGFEQKRDHDDPNPADDNRQRISQVDEQMSVAGLSTTSTISTKSANTIPKKVTLDDSQRRLG